MRCGGKCIPQRPARIQASFNRPRTHHRYYSIHVALIYSSALTAARQGTVKIVKVARKRRITIPKEVCDALDIKPGDYVELRVDGKSRIIVEKAAGIDELAGFLNPGYPVKNLAESLDEERKRDQR